MRMSVIVACLILLVVASVDAYGKKDKDKYGRSSDSLSNVIHRTSLVSSGYHGGHHVIDHGHIGRPIVHNGLIGGYFGIQHSGSHAFGSGHVAVGPVVHGHHLPVVHHVHHVVASPVVYPHHHYGHVVVERHHRHHHRRHRKKKGSSSGSSSNSS